MDGWRGSQFFIISCFRIYIEIALLFDKRANDECKYHIIYMYVVAIKKWGSFQLVSHHLFVCGKRWQKTLSLLMYTVHVNPIHWPNQYYQYFWWWNNMASITVQFERISVHNIRKILQCIHTKQNHIESHRFHHHFAKWNEMGNQGWMKT